MYDIGEYKRIEGSALKIQDERRTEMGILIRGGRIVDAATDTDKTGDIYLEDGIIAEIGQKLKKKEWCCCGSTWWCDNCSCYAKYNSHY